MTRTFAIALAINAIFIVGLLWSATERLHVTVVYSAGAVTGIVGSASVTAPVDESDTGQIGLFLQGADPHASVEWGTTPDSNLPSPVSISEWFYRLGSESAWTDVQVKDLSTNRIIYPRDDRSIDGQGWHTRFGDWFHHPLGGMTTPRPGLASIGVTSPREFEIDAVVLRPRNPAGVLVLSPDGVNGLLFYFRPEDRDVMWYRVRDGQWEGPIASAPFRAFKQSDVASVQDVLRLALGGYPGALGIVVGAVVLGMLETWIVRSAGPRIRRSRATKLTDETAARLTSTARRVVVATTPIERARPPREASPGPEPSGSRSGRAGEQADDHDGGSPLSPVLSLGAASPSPAIAAPSWVRRTTGGGLPWSGTSKLPRAVVRRAPSIAALVLVGAALASTLYVADTVLQRMPHVQDSVAYLFQAKTFALGRLWVPLPAHPDFFKHEFILMQDGRWFSKYPPGWPMLLALGVLAGAPWVVDPICGAISIYVIYRLGAEIYRPRVGLLAAALGVVSPFFLFLTASMMSHGSGLLFSLLFVWGFWRATRSARPIVPAVLAGIALGIGFLIRPYTMIVVALPFGVYALAKLARLPSDGLQRYLPVAVASIPFAIAFLAYNAYFTGNPFFPPQQLWWSYDSVGFGPQHGPWGFTPVDALNNTSRNLLELLEHTYGWPEFLTLSLALVPFVTGRFRAWDWLLAASLVSLVAGYGLWWADGIMYGPRFYFEGLGFLLLLTARGVDATADLARSALSPRNLLSVLGVGDVRGGSSASDIQSETAGTPSVAFRPVAAPAFAYVFAALLVAFNFAYYFPGQWDLYHGYNYVSHVKLDAVERAGIHHALVFADVGQWYEWWEYGMVFSANDPLLRGDVIYARDLGDVEDRKLMADFPGRAFYRLNGTDLVPMKANAVP